MSDQDIVLIVNKILDGVREKENLTSDEALARQLQVSDVAVYRWRNGILPKAAKILIPLLAKEKEPGETPGADKLVMTDEMELSSL